MLCPRCSSDMQNLPCEGGQIPTCTACRGSAITVALLRRFAPKERIDQAWRTARDETRKSELGCPGCEARMRPVALETHGDAALELDACVVCHLVWFDANELASFSPERQEPLSDEERGALAEKLGLPAPSGPMRENPVSDLAEFFSLFMR